MRSHSSTLPPVLCMRLELGRETWTQGSTCSISLMAHCLTSTASPRRQGQWRLIHEALFTDDCALMAHKESQLKLIRNKSAEASRLFSPTISLGNTEGLHQPAPGITAPVPNVFIGGL